MRIILVGGAGTIGEAIFKALSTRHEIVIVGRKHGDLLCDITSMESINKMFDQAGAFDALICAAGEVSFGNFNQMNEAKYRVGINSKLMGQVNLVLMGRNFIRDGGSFTLTSGILNHDPIATGSSASMINGAIDGFVKGTSIELDRGLRINSVSPTVVTESMNKYAPYFRGFEPVPAAKVALAYSKSVEGKLTGQVFRAGW